MRKFLRQLTARSKAVSAHHCTWANKPGYPLITPVSKTCQVPGGGVVLTASLHLLQRHALCLSPVLTSIKAHPQSLDVTKVLQHVLKAKRFHPGGAPGWEWNPNKYFFLFWVEGGRGWLWCVKMSQAGGPRKYYFPRKVISLGHFFFNTIIS